MVTVKKFLKNVVFVAIILINENITIDIFLILNLILNNFYLKIIIQNIENYFLYAVLTFQIRVNCTESLAMCFRLLEWQLVSLKKFPPDPAQTRLRGRSRNPTLLAIFELGTSRVFTLFCW